MDLVDTVCSMEYRLLAAGPVPLWGAELTPELVASRSMPDDAEEGPVLEVMYEQLAFGFRGVRLARLPTLLTTGIDVEPPDAPMYVDFFEKAWEYGGHPKLITAYTWEGLERTYRMLPADTAKAEVAAVQATYPYRYEHNSKIWLSRIDDPNPARREYEAAYGRWCPGDPFASLKAAFVYGTPSDLEWATAQANAIASAEGA